MQQRPELLNVTLAEVVALSDSAFGYIYAYDDRAQALTLHSWSRDEEASEIGDPGGRMSWPGPAYGRGREPAGADRGQRLSRAGPGGVVAGGDAAVDVADHTEDRADDEPATDGPAGSVSAASGGRLMTIPVIKPRRDRGRGRRR